MKRKTALVLSCLLLTLSGSLAYSINVKDFGAKGDGVTDDTAAILCSGTRSSSRSHRNQAQTRIPE